MMLQDKTVIINGVSKRFGRAVANLFGKEGANIVLLSRNEKMLTEVENDLKDLNVRYLVIKCNVTDIEEVKKVIEKVIDMFGQIDVLFNNCGGKYTKRQKMHEMDFSFWTEVMESNIKTIVIPTKEFLPHIKKNGSIINIAAADKTLVDSNTAYATFKSGVIGLTKNLARELIELEIRVNCILPGVIREDFNTENLKKMPENIKRKGVSEDIAYAALYLASSNSSWITGQTLVVDGGESLFLGISNYREF